MPWKRTDGLSPPLEYDGEQSMTILHIVEHGTMNSLQINTFRS